jgi:hypothetical protein
MTAQHPYDENLTPPSEADQADPIGPVSLPKRSLIGRRALALVGTASIAAYAVQVIIDGCSTDTSISNPN